MKDIASRLSVIQYNPPTYTDLSTALSDFGPDEQVMQIMSTGYLYLGFVKPISSCFFFATTASTTTRTITTEIYVENTGWQTMTNLDDTNGLTRSGAISWVLPTDVTMIDTNVNGEKKFWIRLSVSTSTSSMTVRAVSCIFSDDNDLKREFSQICDSSFLLGNLNHYQTHEAVRDEIVQKMRNRGIRTVRNSYYRRLTFWDLLDVQEVRLAATYLAISKIFFNVGKSTDDDDWRIKSKDYAKKFSDSFELAFVTYDKLQDGDTLSQRDFSVGVMKR